jgi:hypothetical protein
MGFSDNGSTGRYLSTPGGLLDVFTGELSPLPEDYQGRMTAVVPGDPSRCPDFLSWVRRYLTRRPESLQWFMQWALSQHPGGGAVRRLLLRGGLEEGDLLQLMPVCQATMGDYAGWMDFETWSRWPKGRTHELAAELRGRRLIFLVGFERYFRFPHQALAALLQAREAEFWQEHVGWKIQPMPGYFLLAGGMGRKSDSRFEEFVDRQAETLPPPDTNHAAVIASSEFLPHEGPAILAWFLAGLRT